MGRASGARGRRVVRVSTRRLAASALVALGVLAACAPPAPPAPLPPSPSEQGLRVMTYNLLGVFGDHAVFSEHGGWAARVDQLRPDVLVLQEAQGDDVQAILSRTSTEYSLAAFTRWECDVKPEREGVAILVRSVHRVVASGGTHVGRTCFEPTVRRVLVWADLAVPGGTFRIYGTHLTAGGSDTTGSRPAQIREIRQRIAQDDPERNGRWLVVGDLNFTPGSYSSRLMAGEVAGEPVDVRTVDTFAELHPAAGDPAACPSYADGDDVGMQFLLANPEQVRTCGYTAGWAKDDDWVGCGLLSLCVAWEERRDTSVRSRIDYVLRAEGGPVQVIAGFVPNRADADWAVAGSEWFRLSDHLPYVVDLELDQGSRTITDPDP